ncbi:MAG: trigger factor [Synergistaceae bacterium]|jgi:trigger factor|nr:trigger factor [Synergistaceae bacterium]
MKTELLEQENQVKNSVKIKIEFEAEEFVASVNQIVQEMSRSVNIPGFRKGHIPRKVIEMRFGKSSLHSEALEKMLPHAIDQVMADYDLDTVGTPSLNVLNMREGEPLVCEVVFEILPEVELPEFGDIEVEISHPNVTDEMLENVIQDIKRQFSTLNPVERPSGEDDVVSITSMTKGESPQTDDVDLFAPALEQKLRNALLGKSKGDKVFFEKETDAGEKIGYNITVNEVKERILPELAPELYKRVLGIDVETEEVFREKLHALLYTQIERDNLAYASRSAVDAVVARSELEISDNLLNRQIEYLQQRDTANCKNRYNMSLEDYLRGASITLSQYEQQLRVQATQELRRELVLDAVRKKFDIEVEQKDVEEELIRLAPTQGVNIDKLQAAFRKDKNRMNQMTAELRHIKSTQAIMKNIKIKEVDGTVPEAPLSTEPIITESIIEEEAAAPEAAVSGGVE